jgi:hypothetical protein
MTRFRAAWATHEAVGCPVAPRTRIRRVWFSIAASTYMRVPHSVTVSKKSHASRASACERRKSARVVEARSGAGSMPASLRISQTVDAATFTSRTRSSPCTDLLIAQLAFQDRDLMPQGKDLHVLVPIAHGKKPQGRERGRHRQVGQSPQHSRTSCRDDRRRRGYFPVVQNDEA